MVLQNIAADIVKNIEKVLVGKRDVIELAVTALLSEGHLLVEDVPGVGKTTLANGLAKSIDCGFNRIQFTPDTLPSDVTGVSVYNMKSSQFEYNPGGIMNHIVLADEINRTSPKTQASLLEAMEEGQVSVDGKTYSLPSPFMVIATQNPIDYLGTYNLPEAQLDRFLFKINVSYPEFEQEMEILKEHHAQKEVNKEDQVQAVVSATEILAFQKLIKSIFVHEELITYIAQVVIKTRTNPSLTLGASPRASIALLESAKASAAVSGRDFVTPEDIRRVASAVLGHRVMLTPEREMEGFTTAYVIDQIINSVEIPR